MEKKPTTSADLVHMPIDLAFDWFFNHIKALESQVAHLTNQVKQQNPVVTSKKK